jgi:Zn finger protein HypA/HybF involved in hydrogenase expression
MMRGKHKNISNRNQGYLASSEPNCPTIASQENTITLEKPISDLKSLLMTMMEDIKKDENNSLKEIQENIGKQTQVLKEKTQKSLKELQENTIKQAKKMNKTIQDLKVEIETIKKSQRKKTLELENIPKISEVINTSITNRIQEIKIESQVQKIP